MEDLNPRKLQNSSWKELVSAKKHCNLLLRKKSANQPLNDSPELAAAALLMINQELKVRKEDRRQAKIIKPIPLNLSKDLPVDMPQIIQHESVVVDNVENAGLKKLLRKLNVLKERIVEKFNKVKFSIKKYGHKLSFNLNVVVAKVAHFNFSNKMNRNVSRKSSSQTQQVLVHDSIVYSNFDISQVLVLDQYLPHNHDYQKVSESPLGKLFHETVLCFPHCGELSVEQIVSNAEYHGPMAVMILKYESLNDESKIDLSSEMVATVLKPKKCVKIPTPAGYLPVGVVVTTEESDQVPYMMHASILGGVVIDGLNDPEKIQVIFRKREFTPEEIGTIQKIFSTYPRLTNHPEEIERTRAYPVSRLSLAISMSPNVEPFADLQYSKQNWLYELLPEHTISILLRTKIGLCDQFSMVMACLKRNSLVARGYISIPYTSDVDSQSGIHEYIANNTVITPSVLNVKEGHANNLCISSEGEVSVVDLARGASQFNSWRMKINEEKIAYILTSLVGNLELLDVALSGFARKNEKQFSPLDLSQQIILEKKLKSGINVQVWMSAVSSGLFYTSADSLGNEAAKVSFYENSIFNKSNVGKYFSELVSWLPRLDAVEKIVVKEFIASQFSITKKPDYVVSDIENSEFLFPNYANLNLVEVTPKSIINFIKLYPEYTVGIIFNLAERASSKSEDATIYKVKLNYVLSQADTSRFSALTSAQNSRLIGLSLDAEHDFFPSLLKNIKPWHVIDQLDHFISGSETFGSTFLIDFIKKHGAIWDEHTIFVDYVADKINLRKYKGGISLCESIIKAIDPKKVNDTRKLRKNIIRNLQDYESQGCPIFSYSSDVLLPENSAGCLIKYFTNDERPEDSRSKLSLAKFHDFVVTCENAGYNVGRGAWPEVDDQAIIGNISFAEFKSVADGSHLKFYFKNNAFSLTITSEHPLFYCLQSIPEGLELNKTQYMIYQISSNTNYYTLKNMALVNYFANDRKVLLVQIFAESNQLGFDSEYYLKYQQCCLDNNKTVVLEALMKDRDNENRFISASFSLVGLDRQSRINLEKIFIQLFDDAHTHFVEYVHEHARRNNHALPILSLSEQSEEYRKYAIESDLYSDYNKIAYSDKIFLKHFGAQFQTSLLWARKLAGDFDGHDLMKAIGSEVMNRRLAPNIDSEVLFYNPAQSHLFIARNANQIQSSVPSYLARRLIQCETPSTDLIDFIEQQSNKFARLPASRLISETLDKSQSKLGEHGEYDSSRPYIVGDNIRGIDWKFYGRTDQLVVKKYSTYESSEKVLLIDCNIFVPDRFLASLVHACAIYKSARGKNISMTIVRSHPIISTDRRITSEMKLPVVNSYKDFVKTAARIYQSISDSTVTEALKDIEGGTRLDTLALDIDFTLRSLGGAGKEFVFISKDSDAGLKGHNAIRLIPPELKIEVNKMPFFTQMVLND